MIDLREQGSKTTDGSGNASVLVGPVPLGQSWWIRTAALDGAAIKSPLVKAYRMGGPSDPSPFFLGLTYGVPAQGGPIMLRSNELLKFVVAGATPTDKLTLYCDGYQLDKGEVPPPFSGSGSVVGPGTFFSGLHADLPDVAPDQHHLESHNRGLWLPVQELTSAIAITTLGANPNAVEVIALADSTTSGFSFMLPFPVDATIGAAFTIRIYWAGGSADPDTTHAVRWRIINKSVGLNTDVTTATGITTSFTGNSNLNRVLNGLFRDDSPLIGNSAFTGQRVRIDRMGSDALDTYAGVANVIGIRLDYPAF